MFNREVIDQLQLTNKLLERLTQTIRNMNINHNEKIADLREDISGIIEIHQEKPAAPVNTKDPMDPFPFPNWAIKRHGWGSLSNSATDIDPTKDIGMAIAIPRKVWSKTSLTYDTVHLLGYICPQPGYPIAAADVVVVDRKGTPRRYGLKNFAIQYPYFYRMSRV